jgi:hypothetical protein
MANDEEPMLPREVDAPERLRHLREEAIAKLQAAESEQRREYEERIQQERERSLRTPAPVYGGPPVEQDFEREAQEREREEVERPPAPVYGGPPVRSWWKWW